MLHIAIELFVRFLKQFKHPNIVEFIGIGAQKQPVMIVMEFVPGELVSTFIDFQSKKTFHLVLVVSRTPFIV